MPLKKYNLGSKSKHETKPSDRIKSGVQSGDSDAELEIIVPIQKHPEMPDLVRAIDPDTKWRGWVSYTPPKPKPKPQPVPEPEPEPTPPPEPTPQELKMQAYNEKVSVLRERHKLAEMGVIKDTDLTALKAEVKTLAQAAGVI